MTNKEHPSGLRVAVGEFYFPYPRHSGALLKGIEFACAPGTITAIMGGNGCGKTTLLRLISGLSLSPTARVELCGYQLNGPHQDIGVVFQDYRLFPWKTVEGNLRCACDAVGADSSVVTRCLKDFSLEHLASAWPKTLSGGEQARAALARCLVQNPKVLLLDEVFRSVDPISRKGLFERVALLTRERSLITIAVTHDIDEVARIADRIICLAGTPTTVGSVIDRQAGDNGSFAKTLAGLLSSP